MKRLVFFLHRKLWIVSVLLLLPIVVLAIVTALQIKPVPEHFAEVMASSKATKFTDRYGKPLNVTYQNQWNVHDALNLHSFPAFLKKAVILSEDKRFYSHQGPDWFARLSAAWTNLIHLRGVRGASTITEQVVRMLRPRPRTLWSRWLEGFEASTLEKHFSKDVILRFYLNQVPFAGNRRGFAQAARYYFDRDVTTLSQKETLALVVLVRAPSRYHLWRNHKRIDGSINRLAQLLVEDGLLNLADAKRLVDSELTLDKSKLNVDASAFIQFVREQNTALGLNTQRLQTTLDSSLQKRVQALLDARLHRLHQKTVNNGACLIVDHLSGEVLVWAVAKSKRQDTPGAAYDTVTVPRQPGSSLKPFLYGLALEQGWTAATLIDDTPTSKTIGHGLHHYQNYSRQFYGPVTLRQALGNSLNIPALVTLRTLGESNYLHFLHRLGFKSLKRSPQFYGDGLALGNGEVTLLEMVQAYSVLANRGVFRPLRTQFNEINPNYNLQVLSPEVSSLLADILSDPAARELEFGYHSLLNFPNQTAVKTGTSSDYRDSWALGFNNRYTVGVWMGNLDQSATDGITGSTGPAIVLRSVFAELNKISPSKAFTIHPNLVKRGLCNNEPGKPCVREWEWFVPENQNAKKSTIPLAPNMNENLSLLQPTPGLHLAFDPRQPKGSQAFQFHLGGVDDEAKVEWNLNGKSFFTRGGRYLWPMERGKFSISARVWQGKELVAKLEPTQFLVK